MRLIAAQQFACLLVAAILADGVPAAESWLDTRAAMDVLAEAGDSEAAIAIGDAYVESMREEFGESSNEYSESLLILADAQIAIGEPGAAAERIASAIALLEAAETSEPSRLIDAWTALGRAHAANDLDALAIRAWENAVDLSRRELGLWSEKQVDLRWLQSQSALVLGDREAANRYRDESRNIAYRSRREAAEAIGRLHGTASREYVDAMLGQARWLVSELAWSEARLIYSEILSALEEQDGDPELIVRTLQDVASTIGFPSPSYGFGGLQGLTNSVGAAGSPSSARPPELQRAERTLNRIEEPDPLMQAAVLRDSADWQLNLDRLSQARRKYRQVLALLEEVEGGEELAREWFDGPVLLQQPWPAPAVVALFPVAPSAPMGQVEAMVSVDRNGWVRDVRVLSADPMWMAVLADRHFRGSRFRPRVVNGEPVGSEGRMTWTFRYDPMVAELAGLTGGADNSRGTEPDTSGAEPDVSVSGP